MRSSVVVAMESIDAMEPDVVDAMERTSEGVDGIETPPVRTNVRWRRCEHN